MGRTQTFDTGTVVRAARTLFWQRGFEDVAVPDLEAATGVGRSSLYHAFGSKRGLFDAAVDNYLEEVVRPRLRPLLGPAVEPAALHDYLTGLRTALAGTSAAARSGCLLVNAATAPVGRDSAVAEVVAAYRAELHAAFGRGAVAAGIQDAERIATVCTSAVVTAFVLARVDPPAAVQALGTALTVVQSSLAQGSGGR
ncbi:TetR/AcrR family transcriptional regulator [Kineococcus rhizosphaerae]|uniref:TetR family transcriptional regulator n=1 Tax=Kineococcus rhizosphaerae TaxID=559628 RepID=A0A2T0R2B4_9ACTN|nr:TetR/AcrR family transcriptional regulator [Kineococcus rhizosphaerae]PRY13924.1 TetR family transcriptional regulator [Kineococcus rhizosphaerae]